ncbi:MAG: isopenicillin N synthase family oxygenase [Bdellovibrionales bacterium]|nr:isopenicillin N synthase family oxygenase [Bdellovibrionales bacterium]
MLPVLNIDTSNPAKAGESLCRALHDTGFLYILGDVVRVDLLKELVEVSKLFFAKSLSEKEQLEMRHAGLAWRGYFPPGAELTMGIPDQKEGLYFGSEHGPDHPGVLRHWPMHGRNLWPASSDLKRMQPLVTEYMQSCVAIGQRLLSYVAVGLDLPKNYFFDRFTDEPTVLFRIFNYPATTPATPGWGVAEHTDMGFLTLLFQDEKGGLEVLSQDNRWVAVPPIEGTLVINIGDMLEYWTHGIFRATPHRVRNPSQSPRLSLPFFFDPNWQATLEPISREQLPAKWLQSISPDRRKRWDGLNLHALSSETTYGDFVWSKIRTVFPDLSATKPLTDKRSP